jgi:hypothetical protein
MMRLDDDEYFLDLFHEHTSHLGIAHPLVSHGLMGSSLLIRMSREQTYRMHRLARDILPLVHD